MWKLRDVFSELHVDFSDILFMIYLPVALAALMVLDVSKELLAIAGIWITIAWRRAK